MNKKRHASDKSPETSPERKRLRVLFADDEAPIRDLMGTEIARMGHDVEVCADGAQAVAALEEGVFDCLLVDLDMPKLNGIEVIRQAKALDPDIEAIILTGKSSYDTAVAALRHQVLDYLEKPCRLTTLKGLFARIADRREWHRRYRALERRLHRLEGSPKLIGRSEAIEQVRALVARVAPTSSTVLIRGETGTGKELVARSLHEASLRADQPFVAVNCGALPEHLIESELFGHRKGAFTGAHDHRQGLFEVADGGTLFLDEIGELPRAMQAKLLRVLESGEVRRLGDNTTFHVDVRLIAATNRDLEAMVEAGEFRADLLFRINTFEIALPPLRTRRDDIPELAAYFFRRFRPDVPASAALLSDDAIEALVQHDWPGNVRELANAIEHACIICERLPATRAHLPMRFRAEAPRSATVTIGQPMTLKELEQVAIAEALERHRGSKPKAAKELGISLKTLYNKLHQAAALPKSA